MPADLIPYLLHGLAWASFGAAHSLLAGGAEGPLGALGRWHRLAYNGIAALHLALVVAAGHLLLGDRPDLGLPGWARGLGLGSIALGAAVLAWGLSGYDLGRFLGTVQLREGQPRADQPRADQPRADQLRAGQLREAGPGEGPAGSGDEPLHVAGANRWVRHPLYLGALLILWGAVRDPVSLSTAIWASLYLLVGYRIEEGRLLRLYGEAYARYRAAVPALVPRRPRAAGDPRPSGAAGPG
jgi:protein-S-isoprenylcysteine O-methyltransferase Ste14